MEKNPLRRPRRRISEEDLDRLNWVDRELRGYLKYLEKFSTDYDFEPKASKKDHAEKLNGVYSSPKRLSDLLDEFEKVLQRYPKE